MKEKLKKVEKIVSELIKLDKDNIFSDFCWPWFLTETNASDFYKKLIYPELKISYKKIKILKKFLRSLFGYLYYRFSSFFSKESLFIGKLNGNTELLIVNWPRKDNFFENDIYYGTLFKELNRKNKKFQILFLPLVNNDVLNNFRENSGVIQKLRNRKMPSLFYVTQLLLKNLGLFKKHRLPFWEKVMFCNATLSRSFLACVVFSMFLDNFFENTKNLKKILIPWENQPEQKAICLAAHKRGIKVYGYIHSALWPDNLSVARLRNKLYNLALPDKLFLHGTQYTRLLKSLNWKEEDLILIRSQRYPKPKPKEYFYGKLFLTSDLEEALFCIEKAKEAITSGLFLIKEVQLHPDLVNSKKIQRAVKSIHLSGDSKDIVVCGTTTVSLEALSIKLNIFNIAKDPQIQILQLRFYEGVEIEKIREHILRTRFVGNPANKFFITSERVKMMIDFL